MSETSVEAPSRDLKVSRAQIIAAKLKVELDERLGKETPDIIKEIAKLP